VDDSLPLHSVVTTAASAWRQCGVSESYTAPCVASAFWNRKHHAAKHFAQVERRRAPSLCR